LSGDFPILQIIPLPIADWQTADFEREKMLRQRFSPRKKNFQKPTKI
jgi:hypothetical protein